MKPTRLLLCALLGLASIAGLAACAGPSTQRAPPAALLHDAWFGPAREKIPGEEIFALSAPMRAFVDAHLARDRHSRLALSALVDALYDRKLLRLRYDSSRTRTAAEAFDARAGNCLALVLMTAAFARELDLPVEFRSADMDDVWGRSGPLLVGSGHISVRLSPPAMSLDGRTYMGSVDIDFVPSDVARGLESHPVPDATVLAMFMNNRAAEALSEGRLDDAYWLIREALRRDPGYVSAYNTLGIVYRHRGELAAAVAAFRYALARAPSNTLAMSNLARSLGEMGHNAESAALLARLAQIDPLPPFHFFDLGMEAMRRHDYEAARAYFTMEIERADYYHEFHFWLGVADYKLGRMAQADEQINLARERSTTTRDRDLYAAKLAWLRSAGAGAAAASRPQF